MTTEPDATPAEKPPADSGKQRDRLTRVIAISLASVVVLGAILATLQTDASVQESTTARETTRTAVRALRANVTQSAILGVESGLQAERDFLPYRRPLGEVEQSLTEAVGLPRDPAQLSQDLRVAAQGLPIARAQQALDRLIFETERTTLKQQALATTRITWNTRSTQYTTVIAILAAALFLVGFGLIVEGRLRGYSYALGLGIAAVVAGMGVYLYFLDIPSTPDAAIAAAARAAVKRDTGDFESAIAEYDEALEIDDKFAAAFRGRAIARLLAANPDYRVTRAFTNLDERESTAAVRDAERALELEKGRDFIGLSVVALRSFYAEDYEKSVANTEAAIEINAGIPDVWLLKSAAELALGDVEAAGESFESAVKLLRGTEPSQRNRALASAYLSYLAWVSWSVPDAGGEAARLAEEAVATETGFTLGRPVSRELPRKGNVEVRGLRYADGRLHALIRYRDLPKGTTLSALEYERPIPRGPWAQPTDLALFMNAAGSGQRRISIPLRRICKPTEVRVDLYLNGAAALSRTGPGVQATC